MKIMLSTDAAKLLAGWAKRLILFTLTVFIFNSCKKELLTGEKENLSVTQNGKVKVTDINYSSFLQKVDLNDLGALKTTFQQNGSNGKLMSLGAASSGGLGILTDSIKQISTEKGNSYIFRMLLSTASTRVFQNLTISILKDTTIAFITTYTPSNEWIIDRRNNIHKGYKGEIAYTPINLSTALGQQLPLLNSSVPSGSGKVMSAPNKTMMGITVCNTVTVYQVTGAYGCSADGHMPWVYCEWNVPGAEIPAGHHGPGYTYGAYNTTICSTISIDDGAGSSGGNGGSSGGGGSGGGETSPYPPKDYNPCEPGLPCTEIFVDPPSDNPDVPDYSYDPYVDQMQFSRTETVYDFETAQYYTYGQIEDFHSANPNALEGVLETSTPPIGYPSWMYAHASNMLNEVEYLSMVHPNWSVLKLSTVATWNVMRGKIHFALDIAGMVPAFGEAADIANAAIYYLEGDRVNVAMSLAAAVPVYGWISTGGKWIRTAGKSMAKPLSAAAGKVAYIAIKNSKGAVRFIKVAVSSFSHSAVTALKAVKPADNTLTNLSRTMIDQLSLRVKPIAQSLKNKIDDIVQNGDAVGTKTETLCDDIFATNGFVKHEAKIGSNNGFDGVYIKMNGSNVQEIIINEAKHVGSVGNIRLNPGTANKGPQMSEEWINQTINEMIANANTNNLGLILNANRNKIVKTVTGVDKASSEIVVLKLSNY